MASHIATDSARLTYNLFRCADVAQTRVCPSVAHPQKVPERFEGKVPEMTIQTLAKDATVIQGPNGATMHEINVKKISWSFYFCGVNSAVSNIAWVSCAPCSGAA